VTRTYALKRLLEHGALSIPELCAITGWQRRQVNRTLQHCMACGVVRRLSQRADGYRYRPRYVVQGVDR
jgi:predicted transcriptional regulator